MCYKAAGRGPYSPALPSILDFHARGRQHFQAKHNRGIRRPPGPRRQDRAAVKIVQPSTQQSAESQGTGMYVGWAQEGTQRIRTYASKQASEPGTSAPGR